jgi:hypothetical protein
VRRSVNPAATQVGQNQGGSEVSSVLGDIPCPYRSPGAWKFTPILVVRYRRHWVTYLARIDHTVRGKKNISLLLAKMAHLVSIYF